MKRITRWLARNIGPAGPVPSVRVPADTPCGSLLDRFVREPTLAEVGIVDGTGRFLGTVHRSHFFALVDVAGEGLFGGMPAERLLRM